MGQGRGSELDFASRRSALRNEISHFVLVFMSRSVDNGHDSKLDSFAAVRASALECAALM